jgi:hypothetical protein
MVGRPTKAKILGNKSMIEEDKQLTEILKSELIGKRIMIIELRNCGRELFIEFSDKGRLFITSEDKLDLSVT